jgi:hypothetical protein
MKDRTMKTTYSEMLKLDFYFAIGDALPQLAEELEFADLDNGGNGGPLIEDHLIVCEMMELFDKLQIGKHV